MLNNLRAMAVFAEVVRQGSFRGAARKLGVSAAALSQNISQLENRLGTALLYRSTRQLTPTDAGQRLLVHAQELLDTAARAEQDLGRKGGPLRGVLRLTVPSGLIEAEITAKIAGFAKQHPALSLELSFSDVQQDLIGQGIDLAIRAGDMPDSTLLRQRIGTIRRVLVCHPDFPAARMALHSPGDLAGLDWVKLAMMPLAKTFTHPDHAPIKVPLGGRIQVDNIAGMLEMCRQGLGLATPPDYMVAEDMTAGRLRHLLPEWQVAPIPVYAVQPDTKVPNRAAQALIAALR